MRNGTYTALTFSLLIHLLIILLLLLTQSTDKPKFKKQKAKPAIKSFLYRAPKIETAIKKVLDEPSEVIVAIKTEPVSKDQLPPSAKQDLVTETKPVDKSETSNPTLLPASNDKPMPIPRPAPKLPKSKLDSFTKLQRLRSKLNRSAITSANNPYQRYQPPSAFNTQGKAVPHSVPLKDEEKEREKNTNNIGAGIAITKSDDGTCSITQDMSAYGLSEGSSTQYFNCGESKFDKSFREHMKKVKTKLGK